VEGTNQLWFIVRDFVKCCAEHVKECSIMGEQHPLSHMHRIGGHNYLKEIRYTHTSL